MIEIATIGHSTHSIERFVALLKGDGIDAAADVRSSPFSRHNPQFNRDALKAELKRAGIAYVFLGRELGARSNDPRDYDGDRVVYARLAASERFRAGIDRLLAGAAGHRIAMMCAEKDPLTCHRTILVARALVGHGVRIRHILPDGTIETHEATIERLIRELGVGTGDMFGPAADPVERAYHEQELRVAYVRPHGNAA